VKEPTREQVFQLETALRAAATAARK